MKFLRITFTVVLLLLTAAASAKSNSASAKSDDASAKSNAASAKADDAAAKSDAASAKPDTSAAQSDAQRLFDKLKTLLGSWDSDNPKRPFQVKFRLSSNGTAIVSDMDAAPDNMVTIYHLDDGRLMMTHYCAAGNQPRMVGKISPDGKTLEFDFLDATNLNSTPDGHMHREVITVADADHHSE